MSSFCVINAAEFLGVYLRIPLFSLLLSQLYQAALPFERRYPGMRRRNIGMKPEGTRRLIFPSFLR